MRICIVEDNRELASVIRDALDPTECQICCTYRQGLAECEKRWDLLLLDVRLPDGSGLDIARAARIVSDVPILFLSSDGMETTMLEAFESGCDDYIVKPFQVGELTARVEAVLRRYEQLGCAQPTEEGWRLTAKGFLLSNTIITDLWEAHGQEKLRREAAAASGDFRVEL